VIGRRKNIVKNVNKSTKKRVKRTIKTGDLRLKQHISFFFFMFMGLCIVTIF